MKRIVFNRIRRVSMTSLLGTTLVFSVSTMGKAAAADVPATGEGAQPRTVQQQIELAAAYFTGHGVRQDEKLAAYWYERAAEAGDPKAQNQIGFFYQIGLGVPKNLALAAHWYQLSAAGGFATAKVNLGVAYLRGIGVPQNVALGAQFFREAAEKGSGMGACYLGDVYYFGMGVPEDKMLAERWYEKGVKLHDARAEFALSALLLHRGNGPNGVLRAAELLRKSSDAGYVPAMHGLGLLLVNQPNLAKSSDEAPKLLDAGSKAGYWKSSATLAILERDGKQVPLDQRAAYYHFRLAALQGGTASQRVVANDLRILAAKLGPLDALAIDAQAVAWHNLHPVTLEFIYKDGENWKRFPAFALADPEDGSVAGRLIPTNPN
jgi:uncharacterized protein